MQGAEFRRSRAACLGCRWRLHRQGLETSATGFDHPDLSQGGDSFHAIQLLPFLDRSEASRNNILKGLRRVNNFIGTQKQQTGRRWCNDPCQNPKNIDVSDAIEKKVLALLEASTCQH